MAAAGFLAMQRVVSQQLREFQKVSDPSRVFERLIQFIGAARHIDVLPEFMSDYGNALERVFQTRLGSRHPHVVPHQLAQLAVKIEDRAPGFYRGKFARAGSGVLFGTSELRVSGWTL